MRRTTRHGLNNTAGPRPFAVPTKTPIHRLHRPPRTSVLAARGVVPVREGIPPLPGGTATTNQRAAQAFSDINAFLRERKLDHAMGPQTLSGSLFPIPLADQHVAEWNRVFAMIDARAAWLEEFLDPQRREDVQQGLVGLGDAIGKAWARCGMTAECPLGRLPASPLSTGCCRRRLQ